MFQVVGALAEFERALIQERVKPASGTPAPKERHWGGLVILAF